MPKAREAVKIPAQFDNPQRPLNVAPGEIVDAFVKANRGLTSAGVAIDCDRRFLREVRIWHDPRPPGPRLRRGGRARLRHPEPAPVRVA